MKSDFAPVIHRIQIYFLLFAALCLTALATAVPAYADDSFPNQTTPFAIHGKLSVQDSELIDEYGDFFQIHGVSTANLAWFPDYVTKDSFRSLRDDWGINTVRLAMYTAEYGGYCVTDDHGREALYQLVMDGVQYASELGMYAVIDWHILSDSDPNQYKDMSLDFFRSISRDLIGYDNVLFEICNEPNGYTTWEMISSYAIDVIDAIRTNLPDSVIIVGTPFWSQDVDIASASPINRSNLLYSLHFYAATHGDYLRQKAITAIDAGLPLLVSEFGVSEASGNGFINTDEADRWLSFLDQNHIGYIMWNLSNKDESSALIVPDCTACDSWQSYDLTDGARWYIDYLQNMDIQPVSMNSGNPFMSADSDYRVLYDSTYTVEVTARSSWIENDIPYTEYDVCITNPGTVSINTWRLRLTWLNEMPGPDSWNYWSCDIGGSGNSWLFVPKEYNSVITPGATVNFGFIAPGCTPDSLIDISLQ